MVQYHSCSLDDAFSALADATRRGVIERLCAADESISGLAEAFRMTPTGMMKHIAVLERAGLVVTEKVGRVRTCRLGQSRLEQEAEWIEACRRRFEARFARLDMILGAMQQEKTDEPQRKP